MRPRFASGSGPPPRHASEIEHERGHGGVIHVIGGGEADGVVRFTSQQDLIEQLRSLASRRVPFAFGELQAWDGVVPESRFPFLLISFTNRGTEWTVHEIVPGAVPPWESVALAEVLQVRRPFTLRSRPKDPSPGANYEFDILDDDRVVARYWFDFRGDDHGVRFTDGRDVWLECHRSEFVRGGGPTPLVFTEKALAWLNNELGERPS